MARRTHGEGSYDIAPDGRHRWRGTVTTATGIRKRKELRDVNRKVLQDKVKKLQAQQAEHGYLSDVEKRTVRQYCRWWMDNVVAARNVNGEESGTYVKYEYDLSRIMPYVGSVQVALLDRTHVQAAVNAMAELKKSDDSPRWSVTTIRRSTEVLRNALNYLVEDGKLLKNPVRKIRFPAAEPFEAKPPTVEEVERLLRAAHGIAYEVPTNLMALMAMRLGEALGVQCSDIDLNKEELTIRRAVKRPRNKVKIGSLKTKASKQTLPIPSTLIPLLREQLARSKSAQVTNGAPWQEYDLLTPSERGTPIQPRNFRRAFKQNLRKAGLRPDIRPHDLRHHVADTLLARGEMLTTVQRILRHASVQTTLKYAHTTDERVRNAVERHGAVRDGLRKDKDA